MLLAILVAVVTAAPAQAQTYTVLHSFGQGTDGASPAGGISPYIARGVAGYLGTTQIGGQYGYGTVFHLLESGGTWSETVVHSFTGADGVNPVDSPLENYGTTPFGLNGGGGTLYSVDVALKSITVLASFCGQPDCASGDNAYASPSLFQASGTLLLYGTMAAGGTDNGGVIYQYNVQTGAKGVVYNFVVGEPLYSRLTEDPRTYNSPIFYGTTYDRGFDNTSGSVFKFDASTNVVTNLYAFGGGSDGANPAWGVIADASGNLFGVTSKGGTHGVGTVFEISSSGTESILHSFTGGADGGAPGGSLALDGSGNLYGTTTSGGVGYGTLFEVSASGTFSVLHTFCTVTGCPDGASPTGRLLLVAQFSGPSSLYGTAESGGTYGGGVAYQLTLP